MGKGTLVPMLALLAAACPDRDGRGAHGPVAVYK